MDTLASPTSSTFSPQVSAQRQRSSYRLFPIVEPTPPTSPTTLQKATLTRTSESHRRRSSSLDKARFPTSSRILSASHAALPAHLSSRDGRKISLQESRAVMTTVHEVNSNPPSAAPNATTFGARAHPDSNARQRFDSASSQSIPDDDAGTNASMTLSPEVDPRQFEGSTVLSLPARHGADSEFPTTPSFQASRFRDKPGPNLRIAVAKADSDSERDDAPQGPMPPPKSPRYLDDASAKSPSISPFTSDQTRSRPFTPSRGSSSTDLWTSQTAASTPVRATATALFPQRGQLIGEVSAKTSRHHVRQSKPLPPIQLPPVQLSPVRYTPPKSPSPVDSAVDPRISQPPVSPLSLRFLTGPATDDGPLPSPVSQFLQPGPHSQPRNLQPLSPSLQNMERLKNVIKSYGVESSVHDAVAHTSSREPELRAKRSEPLLTSRRPERKPVQSRMHSDSVGSITNEQRDPLRSTSSLSNRPDLPDCISRVLAAKANIAALNISDPAPLSSEAMERCRSPVSEPAGVGRLVTPASMQSVQSKSSLSALVDPAATLKELAEQTDALRTRYASLRADRQKLSGSIVAKLQEQKPGPEYANLLLDEQLSLAAVSSSMDICFAKLKALDCRREDAIAALIAQSTQRPTRGFTTSNVSSVVSYGSASSRKLSMGQSTGRLTSEFGDPSNTQYMVRNASYSSEFDVSEYRTPSIRHKSSISSESGFTLESTDRIAPQMVPEAMQRLAAPPLTPVHEVTPAPAGPPEHDSAEESGIDGATESSKEDKSEVETRPSSAAASESKTIEEELFEARPKKIRIDADKAVKILNLLIRSANGKDVPSLKLSGRGGEDDEADEDDGMGSARDVEFEIMPPSKPREARKTPVKKSPKSVASPKKSALRSNSNKSPANTDLDSFPVPNALPILQPRKYEAPLPPLPPIPGWQESSDTLRTTRVADTAADDENLSFKEKAKRRGYSAQTIQTIQVYMDDDMTDYPR